MAAAAARTPLPRAAMLACFATQLSLAVYITLPFTTLVFMVEDLSPPDEPTARLSRRTGLLASLCSLGMFITSLPWGLAADRLGRRPVLLFGCASATASAAALGCCTSYGAACACRLLGGLANGTLGAMKAAIGDVTDPTNSAWAFSFLSVAWGVGAVLGPSLGGLLSRPCVPGGLLAGAAACMREDVPLRRLPYLLPCFACAAFCAAAGLLAWRMPETMAPRAPAGARKGKGTAAQHAPPPPLKGGEYEPLSVDAEEGDMAPLLPQRCADVGKGVELLPVTAASAVPPSQPQPEAADAAAAGKRWFRNQQCVLTLLGYGASLLLPLKKIVNKRLDYALLVRNCAIGLCAFMYIQLDELLPLFSAAPPGAGGLGLGPRQLAAPLAFGGAAVFAFTLLAYPPLVARVGLRAATRGGFLASAFAALFMPIASMPAGGAPSARTARTALLYAAVTLRGGAAVTVFTSSMIMVNRAAPAGQMGEVNGAGQALASLVRGAGPALAGLEWAAAVHSAEGAGGANGAQYGPFAVVAAMSLLGCVLYAFVRFDEEPQAASGAPHGERTQAAPCAAE